MDMEGDIQLSCAPYWQHPQPRDSMQVYYILYAIFSPVLSAHYSFRLNSLVYIFISLPIMWHLDICIFSASKNVVYCTILLVDI